MPESYAAAIGQPRQSELPPATRVRHDRAALPRRCAVRMWLATAPGTCTGYPGYGHGWYLVLRRNLRMQAAHLDAWMQPNRKYTEHVRSAARLICIGGAPL